METASKTSTNLPNRAAGDPSRAPIELAPLPIQASPRPNPSQSTPPQPKVPEPTVCVQVLEHRRQPHRSSFMLWLGFGLVMAGVFFASQDESDWRQIVWPAGDGPVHQVESAESVGTLASGRPDVSVQKVNGIDASWNWVLNNIAWGRWVAGSLLVCLGALCLGGNPLRFLLDSALFLATLFVGVLLIQPLLHSAVWDSDSARWLAAAGCMAVSYGAHAFGRMPWPRLGPVIGFVLIATAGLAVSQGYLNFEAVAPKLGDKFVSIAGQWKHEFTWGVVLLLTSVGVVMSRGRMMHFLSAVLLAALAYYCIFDGSQHVFDFSEQSWPSITVRGLNYVPTWRWILAGELALLSGILLHLSMGVGALTLVFATAWLGLALQVDKEMGRDALLLSSNAMHVARTTPTTVQLETAKPTSGGPADLLTGGFGRRTADAAQDGIAPGLTEADKRALLQKAGIRVGLVFGWVYLTAFFAGIIAASGLRLLIKNPANRHWTVIALWMTFGAALVWLGGMWPPAQNWQSRITSLMVPRTHVYAIWFTALGSAALFSAFSLRPTSLYATWLRSGVWIVFIGTALTLIALAVLINFGGLPSMPVWQYVAIAFGQSCLMWVLLLHHSGREHQSQSKVVRAA